VELPPKMSSASSKKIGDANLFNASARVFQQNWPTSAAQEIQVEETYSQSLLDTLSEAPRGLEKKES